MGMFFFPDWWHALLFVKGYQNIDFISWGFSYTLYFLYDFLIFSMIFFGLAGILVQTEILNINRDRARYCVAIIGDRLTWVRVQRSLVVLCLILASLGFHSVLSVDPTDLRFFPFNSISRSDKFAKANDLLDEAFEYEYSHRQLLPSNESTFVYIDEEADNLSIQLGKVEKEVVSQSESEEQSSSVGVEVFGGNIGGGKASKSETVTKPVRNNVTFIKDVIKKVIGINKWMNISQDEMLDLDAKQLMNLKNTAEKHKLKIDKYAVDSLIFQKSKESIDKLEGKMLSPLTRYFFFNSKVRIKLIANKYELECHPVSFGKYLVKINSTLAKNPRLDRFLNGKTELDLYFFGVSLSKKHTETGVAIDMLPLAIWF